jgi:hypothetical protein
VYKAKGADRGHRKLHGELHFIICTDRAVTGMIRMIGCSDRCVRWNACGKGKGISGSDGST